MVDAAMPALDVAGADLGGPLPDVGGRDGGAEDVAADRPTIDAPTDGARADAVSADHGARDAGATDGGQPDARPSDVSGFDAGRPDAPAADAPADVRDAAVTPDVPAVVDAGASDVPVADARSADVGSDVPRDASTVDVGCAGAGPTVTVTAPMSGEAIETCSESGAPVFFDFAAAVVATAPVLSVGARWITPDGVEAPPPATRPAAPYAFRRQVGGPSAGVPALSVFGLRGTWRVEFTAVDSCGRRTTTSQSFSLIFTSRRCPNP